MDSLVIGLSSSTALSSSRRSASTKHAEQLLDRIVEAIDHPLLERNDRVVRDRDVLGADLGAALGDVAVAQAVLFLEVLKAVLGVERVHLERGVVDEEARSDEL